MVFVLSGAGQMRWVRNRCTGAAWIAARVLGWGLGWTHMAAGGADGSSAPMRDVPLTAYQGAPVVVTWLLFALALMLAGTVWYSLRIQRRMKQVLADGDRAARHERLRSHILGLLAQDVGLPTLLHDMVTGVEASHPGMLCSVLLLDAKRQCLLTGAAPSLPEAFNTAIHGATIGPARGSCGTAASTGQRVVVEDIQTHPYWVDFRELAAQAGLASCWSEPIRSASGQVLGTFAIYHRWRQAPSPSDTVLIEEMAKLAAIAIERARAQNELRQSEERHRLLADHASDVIWTLDPQGCCTYVSPSVQKLRGYTPAEVMEQPLEDAVAPGSVARAAAALKSVLLAVESGERFPAQRHELEQPCKGGGTVWTEVSATGIYGPDGEFKGVLGVSRDISDRKRSEQRIEYMAQHDALTDLPNRTLLEDRMRLAMSAAQREDRMLAVMFLDLDRFKPVNDHHGHAVGDALLKAVAQRLQTAMRASDTVARIGGDEFVVLLPAVAGEADALRVAEKIRDTLSQPFDLGGLVVQVSASIGLALYPIHATDDAALRRHADHAMYVAKEAGCNRVCLYPNRLADAADGLPSAAKAS